MSTKTEWGTPGLSGGSDEPVGDAVSMFAVGSLVAGYRIEQVLATGATGTVYLAKNPTLPRRDALKVLSSELSHDPAFRERFVREADIASLLNHPNIVSIYSRGEAADGHLWIAMQYVAGTDAEAALQAGTMTAARAIRIVNEVAKALDYAHQRSVVHHDVKPGNVLLADSGHDDEHVLLTDFGVARAAGGSGDPGGPDDSILAVTLAYAAPEVIAGDAVDGRADIYSLGCTLFRMLTGKQPFYSAEGTTAVARAHLHEPPPRVSDHLSGTSRQLDEVMARALAKNPGDRYSSARELAAAAAAAASSLTDRSASGAPPGAHPHVANPPPLNRLQPNASENGGNVREPIRITPAAPGRLVQRPVVILWAIFAVLVLIAAVLWVKLLRPSSSPPEATSPATSTTATTAAAPAAAALTGLLPAGYPSGTCTPAPTASDAIAAAVSCGPNTDPGGPTSSTYTLTRDLPTLRKIFTDTVNRSTAVICPPNIQSPVHCPTSVSNGGRGAVSVMMG